MVQVAEYSRVEPGGSSPRFYVRRDVLCFNKSPQASLSSGRRISSGSSDGSTCVGLADPSGQQTLVLLFNPFKPNNPAIQKLATGRTQIDRRVHNANEVPTCANE